MLNFTISKEMQIKPNAIQFVPMGFTIAINKLIALTV